MAAERPVNAPLDVLRNGYWSAQPQLILCDVQAAKGVPVAAIDGVCPAHGGDAAHRQVAALLMHAETKE